MNAQALHVVPKPGIDPELGKVAAELVANGDSKYFFANIDALSQLADQNLGQLFRMVEGRLGMVRSEFFDAIRQARERTQSGIIDGRPVVRIGNRSLNEATGDAIAALEAANDPSVTFRRGNALVLVQRDENDQMSIVRLDPYMMRSRLARVAVFAAYSRSNQRTLCAPPMEIVHDVLTCEEGRFPILKGVTNVPLLHPDGAIRTEPGYDMVTGQYFQPEPGFALGTIPERPSQEDAAQAVAFLHEEILGDFPFRAEADRAHAIGALLAVVLRDSFGFRVPLIAIDATSAGSGKSLLASVLAMTATGQSAGMCPLPENDGEVRKVITTQVERRGWSTPARATRTAAAGPCGPVSSKPRSGSATSLLAAGVAPVGPPARLLPPEEVARDPAGCRGGVTLVAGPGARSALWPCRL